MNDCMRDFFYGLGNTSQTSIQIYPRLPSRCRYRQVLHFPFLLFCEINARLLSRCRYRLYMRLFLWPGKYIPDFYPDIGTHFFLMFWEICAGILSSCKYQTVCENFFLKVLEIHHLNFDPDVCTSFLQAFFF